MPTNPSPSGRRVSAEDITGFAEFEKHFRWLVENNSAFRATDSIVADMLRQAASDATTLAGIRTWLEQERSKTTIDKSSQPWWAAAVLYGFIDDAIRELDRLEGR